MTDGKVIIDTQVNSKGIKTGVKEAQDAIKGFSVSSVAAFAGITLGIGAVVLGLKNIITSALAAGDRVDKLSQKIGISNKAFQEWDYALENSGIDIGVLQPAMKTLNDLLTSAASGSKEAQNTFTKLGVSWQSLSKMNPDERLDSIIAALQKVPDPIERSSLAVDLLGKAATELNVIFNTSAKDTQALKDRSHELGLVLSDDQVKAAAEAGDAIEDLKKSYNALATSMVASVAPALTKVINLLNTPAPPEAGLFKRIASWFTGKSMGGTVFKQATTDLKETDTAIKKTTKLTQEQIDANNALAESYKNLGLNMTLAIGTGMESVGEALVNGTNSFKSFAQSAGSAIADIVSALGNQTIALGIAKDPTDYGKINEGMSLKLLAGVIKATAGRFENGGIVPGNSTTGDRLLARVNSGELILNKAQQGNLASQLTATAKTNVNIQNYAGADVSVNQNGANLEVVIQKQVLKTLGSQRGKRVMSSTFGARAMGIKRGV